MPHKAMQGTFFLNLKTISLYRLYDSFQSFSQKTLLNMIIFLTLWD